MPQIDAVSLAQIVAQASHAAGYHLIPPPGYGAQAGQLIGPGTLPGGLPPLCTDTRYWVDGAPPGNCRKSIPLHGIPPTPPPRPPPPTPPLPPPPTPRPPPTPDPPPCSPQPCVPQPCMPTDGGVLCPPVRVCPPVAGAPKVPWGWIVVSGVGGLLAALQFAGKIGGGKLA